MALRFLNNGYFAGKVGIGETSPSYNLVVGDGTTDTESRFYHNDASYTSVRGYGLFMSRLNSYIRPVNDGSQTLYIGTGSKTWGTLSADANTFSLNRDGVTRLRINSAGNVGIGTTNPNAKLDIQGTQGQLFSVTDDLSGEIFAVADISGVPIMTVNSSGVSYFDGNVGIGTTSPSKRLDIRTSGTGDGITLTTSTPKTFAQIINGNSEAFPYGKFTMNYGDTTPVQIVALSNELQLSGGYTTGGKISFRTATSEQMRLTETGLGIGVTSPGAKLQVGTRGTAGALTPPATDGILFDFHNDGSPYTRHAAIISQAGDTTESVIDFWTKEASGANSKKMTLRGNGNFGIGTDSPAAGLQVALGGSIIPAAGTSTASAVFGNSTSDDNYGLAVGANSSGVGYISSQRTDGTATTYNLAIQPNGGNVSIGGGAIGNPGNDKLQVDGTLRVGPYFAVSDRDFIKLVPHGSDTRIISPNERFHIENESGHIIITPSSAGGIGINTTSPDFKLDVDGTLGVSDLPFNTDSVSVLVADEITGVEEVTNGSFTTDADWNKNSNWTISGGTANADGTSNNDMNQIPVNGYPVVGEVFRVSFEITARTQGTVRIAIGGGATDYLSAVGKYEYIHTALNTDRIRIQSNGSFIGSVDNLSIKQITSASNQIQKRELGTGAFGPTPVGAYLPLAGGTMTGTTRHGDGVTSYWGTGDDLEIYHNSSGDSVIQNHVGDLYFTNKADDKDIVFRSDDGAGGFETYFYLDGSSTGTNNPMTVFPDNSKLGFGNAAVPDLLIYHDSNNSYIVDNGTGDLVVLTTRFYVKSTAGEAMFRATENGACDLFYNNIATFSTTSTGVTVAGDIQIDSALLSNQENTDIDTGAEVVAQVAHATYTAAFFDFVVKKGTNVRSGTVYACHNGDTTPLVEFTETSTNDLGDTSDVTLSVDISGTNMRLLATVTSDDWSVKSLIRAI